MKQLLSDLAADRARLQKLSVLCFALFLGALSLWMFGQGVPGLILGAAALAFYLFWLRGQLRGYSDDIARASVLNGLAEPLKNPAFLGNGGLSLAEFQAALPLPIRPAEEALMLRQGFEGRKGGALFRGWEVTFHHQKTPEKRTEYAFLSGTLITCARGAAGDPGADWLLVRRDLAEPGVLEAHLREKGYRNAVCPDQALARDFAAFSRSGAPLPAALAARLSALKKASPALGAARLSPALSAVFLNRRFYTTRVRVRDLPTEAQLTANPLPERDDVFDLLLSWQQDGASLEGGAHEESHD